MSGRQDRRGFLITAAAGLAGLRLRAQTALPAGLPEALRMDGGATIARASDWHRRRPEILELFTREMYGRAPGRPKRMTFRQMEAATPALGGAAVRKQIA